MQMMLARELVIKSPWLNRWNSFDVDELFSNARLPNRKQGDLIWRDASDSDVCILLKGAAWVTLKQGDDLIKVGIVMPVNVIGLTLIMRDSVRDESHYEFHAAEDVSLLKVSPEFLSRKLDEKPILWRSISESLVNRQRWGVVFALFLRMGSIADRLVLVLNQYVETRLAGGLGSARISVSISQDDMAEMINSSRQHLNRELKLLQVDGVIELGYKKIIITNTTELRRRVKRALTLNAPAE